MKDTKKCSKCFREKLLSEFPKNKNAKDGLETICKKCNQKRCREYQQKNKEKLKLKKQQKYQENKEWYQAYYYAYKEKHPERRKARTAVRTEILAGRMKKASELMCHCEGCNRIATDYHHESYEKERWLDVKPVCRQCHKRMHTR